MPIDTDRQQEDRYITAKVRAGTSNNYGALARNFHLRLARIELAIKAARENHICGPDGCGLCLVGDIIDGNNDWELEDFDYDVTEPPKPEPSTAPRPAAPMKHQVDPTKVTDQEAF